MTLELKAGVIVGLSWLCCSSLLGPEGNQAVNGFCDVELKMEAIKKQRWCCLKPVIFLQPGAR